MSIFGHYVNRHEHELNAWAWINLRLLAKLLAGTALLLALEGLTRLSFELAHRAGLQWSSALEHWTYIIPFALFSALLLAYFAGSVTASVLLLFGVRRFQLSRKGNSDLP